LRTEWDGLFRLIRLLSSQIGVFAIQFVIFKGDIDILISLSVAPSSSLIDNLVLGIGRRRWPKDSLNLLFRHSLVDLVISSRPFALTAHVQTISVVPKLDKHIMQHVVGLAFLVQNSQITGRSVDS
jgi:hypothetical protein